MKAAHLSLRILLPPDYSGRLEIQPSLNSQPKGVCKESARNKIKNTAAVIRALGLQKEKNKKDRKKW